MKNTDYQTDGRVIEQKVNINLSSPQNERAFFSISLLIIGWINQIRSQHQFDPVSVKKIRCRRTSTSLFAQTDSLVD